MKKDIIRVGDFVKVLRCRWVKRVGYPLVWTDLIDEVEADPKVREAWNLLTGETYMPPDRPKPTNVSSFIDWTTASMCSPEMSRAFVRAVAMLHVEQRGFGGRERKIIYDDPLKNQFLGAPEFLPTLEVYSKKVVKTGTYFSGSGHLYDEFSGEYEYEPGGLDNMKTHVLLSTACGLIETCDVEKVKCRSK